VGEERGEVVGGVTEAMGMEEGVEGEVAGVM